MTRRRRTLILVTLVLAAVVAVLALRVSVRSTTPTIATGATTAAPAVAGGVDRDAGRPSTMPAWFLRRSGKAREIAGTVFQDARPVSDALVTLRSSLTHAGLVPERTLRSDGQGRFTFGVLPPARYTVTASAPDRIADRVDVDLGRASAEPPPDHLELYLGQCDGVVHGVVRDASGGVIAHARIGTNTVGQFASRDIETDEHGEYCMCVPPGITAVAVAAAGYGGVERVIVVEGVRRLDVALSPAATVEGTVIDAAGAIVAQAAVRLAGRSDEVERVGRVIAVTDAQGRFQIETAPGPGTLLAFSGDTSSQQLDVELTPGEIMQGVVLRLQARAPIRGNVVMNGAPAAGIELYLASEGGAADVSSGGDGSFFVASGPIGAVHVSSPSHRIVVGGELTVPPAGADHVTVEVVPLARITGRVEGRGAPAVAARISVRGPGRQWETLSDLRGAFHVDSLPAGTYSVDVVEDGGRARSATMSVAVADGEARNLGTIQLAIAGRIAGRVVDDKGQPVVEAYVTAGPIGNANGESSTDDAGAFAINGLEMGPQPISVAQRGGGLEQIGVPQVIELTPERPEIDHVTIRVRPHRGRIAGRVVDSTGSPASDVTVQLRNKDDARGWAFVAASVVTGLDGRFSADSLADGSYAIRAAQRGGGEVVVDGVVTPRDDLEIVLAAEGAIEGELAQFTGPVEVNVHSSVDRRVRRARVSGDRFALRNLAAGDYLVVARSDTEIATGVTHVTPPKAAHLVLGARAARHLVGVVRDLTSKAPVPGMACAAAPRANPTAMLWHAAAPSTSDGRVELAVPADDVAVVCDGGTAFTAAARLASGPTVELWTISRADRTIAAMGAVLADDRFVPRIDRVVDSSAAQRAGLQPGDVLSAISGQSLDGVGTDAAVELWRQRMTLSPLILAVQRGGKIVTLRIMQ